MFLLDGLNYNQGDGEAILEDFDVAALSHAETFRGADASKYGALTPSGGDQCCASHGVQCTAISRSA